MQIAEGARVFMPGSSGEPVSLVQRLLATPGIRITTSFVPGINTLDPSIIAPDAVISCPFMHTSMHEMQRIGRFRHLPISYAGLAREMAGNEPFDICALQVSPPNDAGFCSLGPAAEFAPEIVRRARRTLVSVNPAVPFFANGATIRLADCDVVDETDQPLRTYGQEDQDAVSVRIASHVARHIVDGAAIQVGLGKVPHALFDSLADRRRIRLHSGMLSDGVMALADAGALDPDWEHRTTVYVGSELLYRWAADRRDIRVAGCEQIHDPVVLADVAGLVAVNSALEMDLFGQANLEVASSRAISGPGGAPDFARAARMSHGGISIVALPATFGGGRGSRIKPHLGGDAITTLPRTDVDLIITEEGTADLRGRSVHERAEAIIQIAAPAFRSELADAWRAIARSL